MIRHALRKKLIIAVLLLTAFTVAMVILQVSFQILTLPHPGFGDNDSTRLGEKFFFTREDFLYGPQSWRPYQSRLDIGEDSGQSWILMFVPLNGTPYGGNPALHERGSILVHYQFENLSGEAAFHVYGFRTSDGLWVTNRQEEYGNSAYYVYGHDPLANASSSGDAHLIPDNFAIRLSSASPVLPSSFTLYFTQRPGSGLDALHVTTNLTRKKGEVVKTGLQEGTFFVTHTGGNTLGALLLMVAVSPGQPDDFRMNLSSEFIKEAA
jgi:hypothetical protein